MPFCFPIDAYLNVKGYEKALADFDAVTRFDAKNPKPFLGRGDIYAQKMEYEKALSEYSEAIRLDPGNPDIYWKRSEIYRKKGDLHKSFEDSMKSWNFMPRPIFLDYSPRLPLDNIGDFPPYDDLDWVK
jgi:tetratricopeptide (TPR) repeat protein